MAFAGFFISTVNSKLSTTTINSPTDIYENFFSATSKLWHDGLSPDSLGQSGELIAYTMQGDSFIIITLLLGVILSLYMGKWSLPFTMYKLRNLTSAPLENSFTLRETLKKSKYLTYFIFQGTVLAAILAFVFLMYVLVRTVVTRMVNATFFDRSQRRMSNIDRHFFLALDSFLLLPVTIAFLFLGCSASASVKMAIAGVIITKALYFHKLYCIFFRKNGGFLRFFLYLCTLEAVPIALLIGILAIIINTLSTNI